MYIQVIMNVVFLYIEVWISVRLTFCPTVVNMMNKG